MSWRTRFDRTDDSQLMPVGCSEKHLYDSKRNYTPFCPGNDEAQEWFQNTWLQSIYTKQLTCEQEVEQWWHHWQLEGISSPMSTNKTQWVGRFGIHGSYNSGITIHTQGQNLREDSFVSIHLYFYFNVKKIVFSHFWLDGFPIQRFGLSIKACSI